METDRSRELDEITIDTQADLQRLWSLLMRPLGFSGRSVWLTFVGPDRRPLPSLMEFAEWGERPDEETVAALCSVLRHALDEHPPGWSVAMLITRPGLGGLDERDRSLGRSLVAGAREAGVPLEALHVATDRAVLALAPDDLAA